MRHNNFSLFHVAIASTLFIVMQVTTLSCTVKKNDNSIYVYTNRFYSTDEQLYHSFTEKTGIQVNVVRGNIDNLLDRIDSEGNSTDMNVLFLNDIGRMYKAKLLDILTSIEDEKILSRVDPYFVDRDNKWIGFSMQAKAIMYDKRIGKPQGINTYYDLGKSTTSILVSSSSKVSSNILVAHMIELYGGKAVETWMDRFTQNIVRVPTGNGADQIISMMYGIADIAVADVNYIEVLRNSAHVEDRKLVSNVGVLFPAPTSIDVSTLALGKRIEGSELSRKFLAFLLSDEVQKEIVAKSYEYPLALGIPANENLTMLGEVVLPKYDINDVGKNSYEAIVILDKYGWQ